MTSIVKMELSLQQSESLKPTATAACSTSTVLSNSFSSVFSFNPQNTSSPYIDSTAAQQDTNAELLAWDKKLRNPKLTSTSQGALVQELESSSSAFCKEIICRAKKIKYYATRSFSNLKRIINRKRIDLLLKTIVVYISNDELKNFTTRPLTAKQGKAILELMKAGIRTNTYVARCYSRFTSLRHHWEQLEAPLTGSTTQRKLFPDHTILSMALVIEDAINRATLTTVNSTEIVPYYSFGRTLLFNFSAKKAYIISKKKINWQETAGGAKIFRTALEVDFATLSLFRIVGALKSRVAANLSAISQEFELQSKLQKLSHIARVEFTARGISKLQKEDREFEQLFAIVPAYQTNLHHFINSESYTDDDKMHIAVDILEALAQLHDNKIIHGDVKNENVFIDRDTNRVCHANLSDFGLSSAASSIYHTNIYGTPHISDPSLLMSTASTLFQSDYTKLDMFAFGVLLYELLYKNSPPWKTEMEAIYELSKVTPLNQQGVNSLRATVFSKIHTYRSAIQVKLSIALNEETCTYTIKSGCTKTEFLEYIAYQLLGPLPDLRLSALNALKALANLTKTQNS